MQMTWRQGLQGETPWPSKRRSGWSAGAWQGLACSPLLSKTFAWGSTR